MDIQQPLDQVHAAAGDPQKLTLTTLEIALSVHGRDLRPVVEAAAIPHWFTPEILARMLGLERTVAEQYMERLGSLSMVETFAARGGWNVHETTRLAIRRDRCANQPERFRELSSAASKCFHGDTPHDRIEALYHLLTSEPSRGGDQLRSLYSEWFEAGRFESCQALAAALEELLKSTPPTAPARAHCLVYLARIRENYHDVCETEHLLRDALALLEEGNDSLAPGCRDCLGDTLQKQGRTSEALAEYLEARKIRRRAAETDTENHGRISTTLYSHSRVGKIYRSQSRFEEADVEYRKGLNLTRQLTERFPDDTVWRRLLAAFYILIGNLYAEQGKYESALNNYRENLNVSEGLADLDPQNWEWQRDLAVAHSNATRMYLNQGNSEMAFSELSLALGLWQRLVSQFPDNNNLLRDLSLTHIDLGDIYEERKEFEEALSYYRTALDLTLQVTQQVPGNLEWQRDLAFAHFKVGGIYQQPPERLAEALTEYQISLGIYRQIALRAPGNAQWQNDLHTAHYAVGQIYELQGEFDKALNEYTEARRAI